MPSAATPKSDKSRKSALTFHILMIISMITWGGSWVSAKIVAQQLSPELLSFWRLLMSTLTFIPLIFIMPGAFSITRKGMAYSIIGGALMSVYMFFFFKGLEHWLAGFASVFINSTIPLMTLFLSLLIFRKKPPFNEITGLILGLSGAVILLKLWTFDFSLFLDSSTLILIACPLLWAMITVCSQRATEGISSYAFSFITFVFSTVFFLPFALTDNFFIIFTHGAVFWFNLIYLAVIAGTISTTIYFIAAEKLGSYHASSYIFLVPLTALILSWIFLGEVPEVSTLIGGAIAILAVYMINRRGPGA
jgi:drug/metabolite transporter (DMT)-like permease